MPPTRRRRCSRRSPTIEQVTRRLWASPGREYRRWSPIPSGRVACTPPATNGTSHRIAGAPPSTQRLPVAQCPIRRPLGVIPCRDLTEQLRLRVARRAQVRDDGAVQHPEPVVADLAVCREAILDRVTRRIVLAQVQVCRLAAELRQGGDVAPGIGGAALLIPSVQSIGDHPSAPPAAHHGHKQVSAVPELVRRQVQPHGSDDATPGLRVVSGIFERGRSAIAPASSTTSSMTVLWVYFAAGETSPFKGK